MDMLPSIIFYFEQIIVLWERERDRERDERRQRLRDVFHFRTILCVWFIVKTVDRDEGCGHANSKFCENAETTQQDNWNQNSK